MGGLNSGDKLARGAIKATYSSTEKKITDEKWASIFDGYDPERFKNAPNQSIRQEPAADSGDADVQTSGDASVSTGEAGDSGLDSFDNESGRG